MTTSKIAHPLKACISMPPNARKAPFAKLGNSLFGKTCNDPSLNSAGNQISNKYLYGDGVVGNKRVKYKRAGKEF